MKTEIEQLLTSQLLVWETARNNYEALKLVKIKELHVNGALFKIQFNPARILSSGARVEARSIQERKCFLCAENRPAVQEGFLFSDHYTVLINPFPIFPKHFTIPDVEHVPQLIFSRFEDMLDLAEFMDNYVVFYNGPKCGASAPDHVHFQAGNKGFLPIKKEWRNRISEKIAANLYAIDYGFPALVIETPKKEECIKQFEKIYQNLEVKAGEQEPMMNVQAWVENKKWIVVIIPRTKHRPDCYYAEGDDNMLISPASVDLGGVFITPLEKDFEKITADDVTDILKEVCLDEESFAEIINHLIV